MSTPRRIVMVVVMALSALLTVVTQLDVDPAPDVVADVVTVVRYRVDMHLRRDGVLEATETVDAYFPEQRHGIYRLFDTRDERRDVEHPVQVSSVTRDGRPEPWSWDATTTDGVRTARIGSASTWVEPGLHRYVITWRTTDVVAPAGGDLPGRAGGSVWWWNLVGDAVRMPVEDFEAVVVVDGADDRLECVRGAAGECASVTLDDVPGGSRLRVTAADLAPGEALTVRAHLDAAEFPPSGPTDSQPSSPWGAALAALAAALVGAAVAGALSWRGAERAVGLPVMYAPPPGVRPALAAHVVAEKVPADAFQATVLDWAERHIVSVAGAGGTWSVALAAEPAAADLAAWERSVLAEMGLARPGDEFTVTAASATAGRRVAEVKKVLAKSLAAEARPYLAANVAAAAAKFGGIAALLALAAMAFVSLGGTHWPLWAPLGACAFVWVAAPRMVERGATTRRTPAGRDLWSRAGGFERFLCTESSESRFDAAAHLDWFPTYLPWAMAFGVSKEWSRRYAAQGITDPPVPYVQHWDGTGWRPGDVAMFSSFTDTVEQASAAYAATQRSSSSGGGGFSGGSGGGGGGMGSW